MRHIFLFVVPVLATASFASLSEAAPIPNRAVHTNNNRFRIPYRFDKEEMRRLNAREIRLYASTNQGTQWQQVQSVAPADGKFEFLAPQDGEYWFAVRTLDGQGRLHPEGNVIEPGLKVIVDTAPPQLSVSVRQIAPGRVQLTWNATDSHLDPIKLRLEYVQSGGQKWQQVSVTPQAAGKTSWSVPNGGTVAVRGSIADYAKNTVRAQAQARIEPANQAVPKPSVPDFSQPIASGNSVDGMRTSFPNSHPQHPQVVPQQQVAPRIPDTTNNGIAVNPSLTESQAITSTPFTPNQFGQPPFDLFRAQNMATQPASQPNWETKLPSQPNGLGARRSSGRVRTVRTKRFQIDYRIDDVGASGISRVELFITQDAGQKWWKYGDDPDRKSPFQVEVPGDGTYGFALRVHSGVGLAEDPPQPGEPASIVIVVDQSPPVVHLMPLQQGTGPDLNKILIRWRITDQNPSEKPISLSYSPSPSGPWEPISGWQPDTGRFVWKVTSGVPSKLYVRLVARDSVGNMSKVETPQPVLVDLTKPSARIVDVEPVEPRQAF